jgi:hypothetical protein
MAPTTCPLGPSAPPPPSALPLIARAHILLRTSADLSTELKYGALAVCGIMLYGSRPWQLALRNAASLLQDEEDGEDGMVIVDFEYGRGVILDRDVECVEDEDGEFGSTSVEEEIGGLVKKAIAEIKKWDREMGKRVGDVVGELVVLCEPGAL